MLRKFSSYLSQNRFQRHFFFLSLAILATAINGYHFGTFDQVFHITFLKKFVNPQLYPNDPFLDLRWVHYSYFWFPLIAFAKSGYLELVMFLVHLLTVYGTVAMFWALSDLLFHNPTANLLVTLSLLLPHLGFPGFQIIEFSLLNRTFVLPFVLGSIWLYLKDKKLFAFFLLGLMFNLHVIYATFVLCMFLLNEIFAFKLKAWWRPMLYMAGFVMAGLPVLIWRMQTGGGIDLTLRPEMLDLAARGLLGTVYTPLMPFPHAIGNLVAGAGTVAAFVAGYRLAPKNERHQAMRSFVLAIAILIGVGLIASYLLPVTILLQMQLLRAGVFVLYFGMLYASYFLSEGFKQGCLSRAEFLLLGLSLALLINPLAAVLLYYLVRHLQRARVKPGWLLPVVILFQGITVTISARTGLWAPGFHLSGPRSPWREVQEWVKTNTPVDAKFITPPHQFWHYTPDWRVFSERATVATIPEMMEIPFAPDFEAGFRARFNAVAPGAIEQFNGDYMRSLAVTRAAFYANTTEDFIDIGCRFSADYLVVERDHPADLALIFQNEGFEVYSLPECDMVSD